MEILYISSGYGGKCGFTRIPWNFNIFSGNIGTLEFYCISVFQYFLLKYWIIGMWEFSKIPIFQDSNFSGFQQSNIILGFSSIPLSHIGIFQDSDIPIFTYFICNYWNIEIIPVFQYSNISCEITCEISRIWESSRITVFQ